MFSLRFTASACGLAAASALAASASAQTVNVFDGQTSVLLDVVTLSSAAGLDLSGVSPDVIAPGNLGADSVAFDINARDAGSLPTTFSYDPADFLGTFGGTIEHTGSVFFNTNTVEVGDFTIGFDGARVDATAGTSGFFVESTTGVAAILFDIENPTTLSATDESLTIGANLLVSPEFATFLGDAGLTGADVGEALVEAQVPEPASLSLLALGGLALVRRRR